MISERSERLHPHLAFRAHDPFPAREDDSTDPTVECDAFLLAPHFAVVDELDEMPSNDAGLRDWWDDAPPASPEEWWKTQTARILASSTNVATNPSSNGFATFNGGVSVMTSPSPPLRTR